MPKLLENERKISYGYQPKLVVNTEIVIPAAEPHR